MPRKKLIRRFEPRYTVSQQMVDRESKYVQLEHADYLLGSIHDLRDKLKQWQPLCREVNQTIESLIGRLGAREALAYRCMIARDLYHILELYCTSMRKDLPEQSAPNRAKSAISARERVEEESKVAAFSEWLFAEQPQST